MGAVPPPMGGPPTGSPPEFDPGLGWASTLAEKLRTINTVKAAKYFMIFFISVVF